MNFDVSNAIEILEQTPFVVETLLTRLSPGWTSNNEGKETWSPYDVVGHLIHGEKTDWIPRMEIILSINPGKEFQPFDRFAQFKDSHRKNLRDLLDEFKTLRAENIRVLKEKKLSEADLMKTGIHPDFGSVTLKQLLSTWVVHDLEHIAQIARVMSKQYKDEVGPWTKYLPILNK
jgi:uncharacterized damage-inducible protein DinB